MREEMKKSCENGCLQIVPGSHLLGRLNHNRKGDLASVDTEDRFPAILDRLGGSVVFVETEPGDVLFFHRKFSLTMAKCVL